jgi:hypothetical protein
MTDQNTDDASFGKRFAETWELLQTYLGDLDPKELARMGSMDFQAALKLLKLQPAVGQSGALDDARGKTPEQLALAIIQERLQALTGKLSSGPGGAWGGRFLQHWRKLGGPISSFKYAQIQALKVADQEGVVKMFKQQAGSFQVAKVLRESSPEDAATILLQQQRLSTLTLLAIMF